MKFDIYNQEGKKISMYDAPDGLFNLENNNALLHQVYTIKWSNRRRNYAHTKTRADVRGGGRKPWRQKGTGRARHGSIRSPLWVGGGVTFGPRKERVYKRKINRKMNIRAIFIVLSSKAKGGNILIIDSLEYKDPKTKLGAELLKNLKINTKTTAIYGTKKDSNFKRVFNNVLKAKPLFIDNLNIIDILQNANCIFSKAAMDELIVLYKDKIKDNKSVKIESKKVVKKKKLVRA